MNENGAERKTLIVIILTLVTMIAEIVVGHITHSMALFADGWHMGTHALALSLTFFTYILIRKFSSSENFVFGTGKFGTLSGYTSSILLGLTGLAIIIEAVSRMFNRPDINFNEAIIVAIIGLIVNTVCILIMGGHSHQHQEHHHDDDLNFKAAYFHILADAMTSIFAIGALLSAKYLGWTILDPIVGCLGGFLICNWALALVRTSGSILLDTENKELKNHIEKLAIFNDLHVWQVGDDEFALTAKVYEGTDIDYIKSNLKNIADFKYVIIECKPKE